MIASPSHPAEIHAAVSGLQNPDRRLRVVYVCCHGRSGSTLVGAVIGMLDGCCFVGEVRTAWSDGVRDNRNCGCGKPFRECPFWKAVFDQAYGGFDTDAARAASELLSNYHRPLGARFLHWTMFSRASDRRLTPYIQALAPLYRAIHDVSGGKIIVDTSKHSRFGMLVASIPGVDIRFINLVRDVRGVVLSRARPALMRDGQRRHADQPTHPRYRIVTVVLRWIARNEFGMKLVRRYGGLRVLYEQFARDPRPTLAALADDRSAAAVIDRLATAGDAPQFVQHQLAGNWIRGMKIEVRETWRTELPGWVRIVTTCLAWPFLRRYRFEKHRAGGLFKSGPAMLP